MPHYTIDPIDRGQSPTESEGRNAGAVLTFVACHTYREADVFTEGEYVFSVRLSTSGMWSIFQRDGDLEAPIEEFG